MRLPLGLALVSAAVYALLHAARLRYSLLAGPAHWLEDLGSRHAVLEAGFPGALGTTLFLALGLATAGWVAARVPGPWWRRSTAAMLLLGLALVLPFHYLGVLGLATGTGWLTPGALVAAGAAQFLVALGCVRRPVVPGVPDGSWTGTAAVSCVLLAAALLAASWEGWVAGPRTYDSHWYHLPTLVQWQQQSAPVPLAENARPPLRMSQIVLWYPGNGHALAYLALGLPEGGRLVTFFQAPWALLAAFALYGLARRLGQPPSAAWLPPVAFLAMPMVLYQVRQPMMDLVETSFVLAAMLLAQEAWDREADGWTLPLFALACGLAAGTKPVALPVLGLLALGIAWRQGPRPLAWAAAGVFAGLGFWALRSYVLLGTANPVAFRQGEHLAVAYPTAWAWLSSHWTEVNFNDTSGAGPLVLSLGVAGVALLPRRAWPLVGLTVVSMLPWWVVTLREPRHVLYAYGVACVVAGFALRGRAMQVLAVGCLAVGLWLGVDAMYRVDHAVDSFPWHRPSVALMEALDRLPPGRLAPLSEGAGDANCTRFYLSGRRFQHRVVNLEATLEPLSGGALVQALRTARIDALYVRTGPGSAAFRHPDLEEVYRGEGPGWEERLLRVRVR